MSKSAGGRRAGDRPVRGFDVAGALVALVFFAPLMVLIPLLVMLANPGPPIFAQTRIGRGGRPFRCYKFRTMAVDAEQRLAACLCLEDARQEWASDAKLRRDPRIVGIGRFLRQSSLDELPQFWNVLRGEMSLVGPRPITAVEAIRYGRHFETYCQVRPGLTGLWQVSGRSLLSYRRRVALDIAYVRSRSLLLDLKILFVTVPSMLAGGAF